MAAKSHFIDGVWIDGAGQPFKSTDPGTASADVVWEGPTATPVDIDSAVAAARNAWDSWADLPIAQRIFFLQGFAQQLKDNRAKLAEAISRETGKPTWEALGEVDSMINKVPVSIEAFNERRRPIELEAGGGAGGLAATRFKPYGVV